MVKMKSNILFVGFLKEFNESICTELAKSLSMYVADVPSLIAYELVNLDEMITVCGKEYYDKQERKVISRLATFENTIFNINYDLFSLYGRKYFENSSHIIYVRVDENKLNQRLKQSTQPSEWSAVIDLIDFEDRDKFLNENADFVVHCDKLSTLMYCKKIKDYFNDLYKRG